MTFEEELDRQTKITEISKWIEEKIYFLEYFRNNEDKLLRESSILEIIKLTSCMTTQERTGYIVKKIALDKGYSLGGDLDSGDATDVNGNRIEIKVSIIERTSKTKKYNIVQVRLWQDTGYDIWFFNEFEGILYHYFLTKEEMIFEMTICRASSAHGTVRANAKNVNKEKRKSFSPGNKNLKRWNEKYLKEMISERDEQIALKLPNTVKSMHEHND